MTGFRKFLVRSNLVDLSVAVVVGVAFSNVVQALIKDLITPLIAALGGKPNFSNLVFSINKSHFRYGDFINVALYFLIIAAVIYYFVVVPANRITLIATRNTEGAEHQLPGLRGRRADGVRHRAGHALGAVHDHLVVLEEDQARGRRSVTRQDRARRSLTRQARTRRSVTRRDRTRRRIIWQTCTQRSLTRQARTGGSGVG